MTELYEEFEQYHIPEVKISLEDFRKNYQTYSIMSLNNSDIDIILAAEDIIKIYLLMKEKETATDNLW